MLRAQHRIMLIGWDLDARMTFERGAKTLPGPNQLGAFLYWMLWKRPSSRGLPAEVQSAPAAGLRRHLVRPHPRVVRESVQQQANAFRHRRRPPDRRRPSPEDRGHRRCGRVLRWPRPHRRPMGHPARMSTTAAAVGRWGAATGRDTRSRRRLTARPPAHSANRRGERWETATGQSLAPVDAKHAAWPSKLEPTLRDVDVGIARTLPELDDRDEVREVEALNLAAIAAARHTIYLENQYLAARTHRRCAGRSAEGRRRSGDRHRPSSQRQQPARAGDDGRRPPPAHPGAVGSRRASTGWASTTR